MTGDMISKDDTASGEAEPSTAPPETAPPPIDPLKAEGGPERAEPEDVEPEGAAIEDAPVLVSGGAAFLHAPTGRRPDDLPFAGDFPDVPEVEYDDDEEDDDEPVIVGFDRRTDMWWLITPLVTLFVAPLIAGLVTFVVTASDNSSPAVCRDTLADNGCEEAVLRMIGQHTVAFGILWLGLWALPWYRGLRKYRITLALVAFAVLLAVPLRLVGD